MVNKPGLVALQGIPILARIGRVVIFLALLLPGWIEATPVSAAENVYANGREIACKAGRGKVIAAFPDVCLTPPQGSAVPPGVPIPYPNIGKSTDSDGGTEKVKADGKMARVKGAEYGSGTGGADSGGAGKSAASGKTSFQTFDFDVKLDGKNCVRQLGIPTGNHASATAGIERFPLQQNPSGQAFVACNGSLFATTIIPAPPPHFTFVDAPLHEGVIFDFMSPHEEEVILDGSEGPTAEQIAAAEAKVREYVKEHPDEGGYDYQQTLGSTGSDGNYVIEVRYGTATVPNIYAARFDIEGNMIGRPGITPDGRVELTINGITVKGDTIRTTTRTDIDGNKYTAKVEISGGGGYYLFNEQGLAYLGEVYHPQTGERSGAGLNPNHFPVLADHGEPLLERDFVQLVQTRCPIPCQAVTDVYNSIAAEINLTVQRMNNHAAEHRKDNAVGLAAEADYEQEMLAGSKASGRSGPSPGTPVATSVVQKNRARYEGLAETLEVLEKKLEEARRNLEACTCPGEAPGPLLANTMWPDPYGALPANAQPCLQQLAALDTTSERGGQSNDDDNIIVMVPQENPLDLFDRPPPVVCDDVYTAQFYQGGTNKDLKRLMARVFSQAADDHTLEGRPTSWQYGDPKASDSALSSNNTEPLDFDVWRPVAIAEHVTVTTGFPTVEDPNQDIDKGADRYIQGQFNAVTDQWWLQRIESPDPTAPVAVTATAATTVVAVIDSGVDLLHPGLLGRIWANPGEIPGNGLDDDNNGLVDDINGWNFVSYNNDVRDTNGHGTLVAGIIASQGGNGVTHGIDPGAQVMVLKVTNFAGRGNSINVAAAVSYAVAHGAKVINISLGGEEFSPAERDAIAYATGKGALVVIAAGNQSVDSAGFWPAAVQGAITVAATDREDKRADYSNWGEPLDIAAPGTSIVALRARYTDPMLIGQGDYEPGSNIVGASGMLYRATGTSFAAPMVAGAASRALSQEPTLTVQELRRMLLYSARDLGIPGPDILTGYGILQVEAALNADPGFFIEARISGVRVTKRDGKTFVQVLGSADANEYTGATLRMGAGENPGTWQDAGASLEKPVLKDVLAEIDAQILAEQARWTLQLEVRHANGSARVGQFDLKLR